MLAADVRAEIESANWKLGQCMPGIAWLAEEGRAEPGVAADAIELLEQDGWLTSNSTGGYLICVPVPLAAPASNKWLTAIRSKAEVRRSIAEKIASQKVRESSAKGTTGETSHRKPLAYFTYLIGIDGLPFMKIGHTTKRPEERLKSLQTGQPMDLHLLWSAPGDYESELHVRFAAYRVRGEWFDLTPLGDAIDVVKAAVGEIEACR